LCNACKLNIPHWRATMKQRWLCSRYVWVYIWVCILTIKTNSINSRILFLLHMNWIIEQIIGPTRV
jgi:hypothetical protein